MNLFYIAENFRQDSSNYSQFQRIPLQDDFNIYKILTFMKTSKLGLILFCRKYSVPGKKTKVFSAS